MQANKLLEKDNDFVDYFTSLHLTPDEISRITEVYLSFKRGETICKQGSFASHVMILRKGIVKAYVENSQFKSHIFKVNTPLSIIGLSCLYGDGYYHFGCRPLVDSRLYIIERNVFDDIVRGNPAFAIEMMRLYSQSLQNTYDKLSILANKQAMGKVSASLLYLSQTVFNSDIIDPCITRRDLAELSGLATENLVRSLSELKKDGTIEINNKVIKIANFNQLKILSDLG